MTNIAHLAAAAQSFANLSDLDAACYRYTHGDLALGNSKSDRIFLNQKYTVIVAKEFFALKPFYRNRCLAVALEELAYPRPVGDSEKGYRANAWSTRQRMAFAEISKSTWYDNKLSDVVDWIINDIETRATASAKLVADQLSEDLFL